MVEVFKLERELVSIMDGFANKLQTKLDKINAYLEVSTCSNAKNIKFFEVIHIFDNGKTLKIVHIIGC